MPHAPFFTPVTDAIGEVLEFTSTSQLRPETVLETDLGMDSGLMLELIMQLEDTVAGLEIDQATISYDQFKTVASVCDFIAENVKSLSAA
jgi:acyl carrier protein